MEQGGAFQEVAEVWWSGVQDALRIDRCLFFLAQSKTIRCRTLQCVLLNGVIFIGSILFYNWLVDPLLMFLKQLVQNDDVWATEFISGFFAVLYKVMWIYPLYGISFVLNIFMYKDIAGCALQTTKRPAGSTKTPCTSQKDILNGAMQEPWRTVVNLVYLLQMQLLACIPVFGPLLYFLHSCWMASIYCFEYRWGHQQWSANARAEHVEGHWMYFFGFGFPVSIVTYVCPRFIDGGVFAVLFPLFVLTATDAEPKAVKCPKKVPIFMMVQRVSCILVSNIAPYIYETVMGLLTYVFETGTAQDSRQSGKSSRKMSKLKFPDRFPVRSWRVQMCTWRESSMESEWQRWFLAKRKPWQCLAVWLGCISCRWDDVVEIWPPTRFECSQVLRLSSFDPNILFVSMSSALQLFKAWTGSRNIRHANYFCGDELLERELFSWPLATLWNEPTVNQPIYPKTAHSWWTSQKTPQLSCPMISTYINHCTFVFKFQVD